MIFENASFLPFLFSVPVLVFLYYIQPKRRELLLTTFFLLPENSKSIAENNRLARFKAPLSLFLQVLFLLFLLWVLLRPLFPSEDRVLKLAVVVDASLSMTAFRERAVPQLESWLEDSVPGDSSVEYSLLSSDPGRAALYFGSARDDFLSILSSFESSRLAHSFQPALQRARSLVGKEGLVLLLTDHSDEEPSLSSNGVLRLSIGEPRENIGFLGSQVFNKAGQTHFKALLMNHSSQDRAVNWWMEVADESTEPSSISLPPNGARELSAPFPAGSEPILLRIDSDSFEPDDLLLIQRPKAKVVKVDFASSDPYASFFYRIIDGLPGLERVAPGESPMLRLRSFTDESVLRQGDTRDAPCELIFRRASSESTTLRSVLPTGHEILRGLDFSGLIVPLHADISLPASDELLLFHPDRPLVSMRETNGELRLRFLFDIQKSNLSRMPFFPILLNRFFDRVRAQSPGFERVNLGLGSSYSFLPFDAENGSLVRVRNLLRGTETEFSLPAGKQIIGTEIREPSFVQISQDGELLADLSFAFSDLHEGNLLGASASVPEQSLLEAWYASDSDSFLPDSLADFWLVLALVVLLLSWQDFAQSPLRFSFGENKDA